MTTSFTWADPSWFWALAILPLIMLVRRWKRVPVLVVPFAAEWQRSASQLSRISWPAATAYTGAVMLIAGLARPQIIEQRREQKQQGYDIVLAIDLSESMLAEDFVSGGRRVNRLEALKPVLRAFIDQRPNDRIGVVVFAALSYTLAPLTFDHDWLRRQTDRMKVGLVEGNKTAIGDGLGVALARLDQGRRDTGLAREGAFVVLLTDGANNAGALDPQEVGAIAAERGIPVFTIGAGREGIVDFPVLDHQGRKTGHYTQRRSELDETLLRDIADLTNGRFFRADSSTTIREAFESIDQAKKIEFEAQSYRVAEELYTRFTLVALALLALAVFGTSLRRQEEALA